MSWPWVSVRGRVRASEIVRFCDGKECCVDRDDLVDGEKVDGGFASQQDTYIRTHAHTCALAHATHVHTYAHTRHTSVLTLKRLRHQPNENTLVAGVELKSLRNSQQSVGFVEEVNASGGGGARIIFKRGCVHRMRMIASHVHKIHVM